jgi:Peptidase family C78
MIPVHNDSSISMDTNKSNRNTKEHQRSIQPSLNQTFRRNDIIDLTTTNNDDDCCENDDINNIVLNIDNNNTSSYKSDNHMMTKSNNEMNLYKCSHYDEDPINVESEPTQNIDSEIICLCDDDDDDENDNNDVFTRNDGKDSDTKSSIRNVQHLQDERMLTEHGNNRASNYTSRLHAQLSQHQQYQHVNDDDNEFTNKTYYTQESTKRFKTYNDHNDENENDDDVIIIDDSEILTRKITNDRTDDNGTYAMVHNNKANGNNTGPGIVENVFGIKNNNNTNDIHRNDSRVPSIDTNVLVYIDDTSSYDDCKITAGIMDLIQNKITSQFHDRNSNNKKQEQEKQQPNTGKRKQQRQQHRTIYTCYNRTIQHIEQQERWSCGYRNTQMLLSSLIPLLSNNHTYYSGSSSTTNYSEGICAIPSIRQIQQTIQEYWSNGYDSKGAIHYNYTIINTTSKIGAVEVATYLQYKHLDCCIVQFMKCVQSRQLIGPFCYNYFYYHTDASTTTNNFDTIKNSQTIATNTLNLCTKQVASLTNTTDVSTQQKEPINQKQIPLYLQWEGHSVTIIGVELRMDNTIKYLLVFDPAKNGKTIHDKLSTSTKDISVLRLPCSTVEKKDCQLIVCSTQSISIATSNKKSITAITAAEQDVIQSMTSSSTTTSSSQQLPQHHGYY